MRERFIGLMTGTSMDAIDVALMDLTQGLELVYATSVPLPAALRDEMAALAAGTDDNGAGLTERLGRADRALGEALAAAVLTVLERSGHAPRDIRAVGSHGQTLRHQPSGAQPFTLQIGDPNVVAERTGITTVADFRRRDLAAGGQGAPLAPAFHAQMLSHPSECRVVLNLGGIANVTVIEPGGGKVRGFDTGPANTLLDAWHRTHQGGPWDAGGAWAATGREDGALLERLLAEPYFEHAPPKSTGPELFNLEWLRARLDGERPEDVQATLTALTAVSVARAVAAHAPRCARVLACGGGVHNTVLMARLAAALDGLPVESTAAHGLDPDWVEAAAFAWLAHRTLAGLPGNLPTVTGAAGPRILGAVYPGGTGEPPPAA